MLAPNCFISTSLSRRGHAQCASPWGRGVRGLKMRRALGGALRALRISQCSLRTAHCAIRKIQRILLIPPFPPVVFVPWITISSGKTHFVVFPLLPGPTSFALAGASFNFAKVLNRSANWRALLARTSGPSPR